MEQVTVVVALTSKMFITQLKLMNVPVTRA